MAHMNLEDMLRDHETHLRRLEGEVALFMGEEDSEQRQMTDYLEQAISAERQVIDAVKKQIASQ